MWIFTHVIKIKVKLLQLNSFQLDNGFLNLYQDYNVLFKSAKNIKRVRKYI